MVHRLAPASLVLWLCGLPAFAGAEGAPRERAFEPLPLGSVKPTGWLRNQLQIQAKGLSGSLDLHWPDLKQSAWVGGRAEGWERAPYWLDGVVPLAFLTDDKPLQSRIKTFVDYVLEHQQADGWLGPVTDGKHPEYDPWPLFVLFKAFIQYQEATGDPRIVPALVHCAVKIDEVISRKALESWGRFRAADFAVSLDWLYAKTHDDRLIALAKKALAQGFDWRALHEKYPFAGRVEKSFDLSNHGVNTAMGLKFPALRWLFGGEEADRFAIQEMLAVIDKHHGQMNGMFTCDEHLAGRSPSQGTELCTVVEETYSLETAISITGQAALGDRLEKVAFNAMPATFKPDMTAHQYDQQSNQVVCTFSEDRPFATNGADANLFGLEPNFGCCTANMHQGWPKLATHAVMKSHYGGLAAVALVPCRTEVTLGGAHVTLEIATDYPFRDSVVVTLTTDRDARFPLLLRIPGWCSDAALVEGANPPAKLAGGAFHRIERTWSGATTLTLKLPMPTVYSEGFHRSATISRGPLVYSLLVGTHWRKIKDNPPFADWEVFPTTPWNYALSLSSDQGKSLGVPDVTFVEKPMSDRPFSPEGAPVLAIVRGRRLPEWTLKKNAAAPPPASPVSSDEPLVPLTLAPYGCTTLRVTEFPVLKAPGSAR